MGNQYFRSVKPNFCNRCGIEKDPGEFYHRKNGDQRTPCKLCVGEQSRIWQGANLVIFRLKSKEWSRLHPESKRNSTKRHKLKYPEKNVMQEQKRRARVSGNGGSYTILEWEQTKKLYNQTCLRCGKNSSVIELTVDHVTPISRGGINCIDNIQSLCKSCNCIKHSHDWDYRFEYWMNGGLV